MTDRPPITDMIPIPRAARAARPARCAALATSTLLAAVAAVAAAAPPGPALSYRTPPEPGERVRPQRDLLVCDDARAGARATARTGFLARGCRRVGDETGWRVVGLDHERIEDGGLWLVRVERPAPGGAGSDAPRAAVHTGWIPLPWHDWA